MGDIYELATQVVVWLGFFDKDVQSLIWAHNVLYDKLAAVALDKGYPFLESQSIEDPAFWRDMLGFKAPRELFKRFIFVGTILRWFSRSWVLQEVSLARNIVIRCGKHQLSWKRMQFLWVGFEQSGWMSTLEDRSN